MKTIRRVLFLDDMKWRHSEFRNRVWNTDDVRVFHVYTSEDAVILLQRLEFDQVFLDHDLSEEDIMVDVGVKSSVPTGMAVVDHIMTMENPPQDIIIHSCNGPAAIEMEIRLAGHPAGIKLLRRIPFPHLIQLLEAVSSG